MRDRLQTLLAQLRFHGMAAALDAEIERRLAYRLDQPHLP